MMLHSYLSEALAIAFARRTWLPALLLLLVLTFSNIVILWHLPGRGDAIGWQFVVAAAVRVGGLLLLSVAFLRLSAGSDRVAWWPDGAFWLYALIQAASFAIVVPLDLLTGPLDDLLSSLLGNVVTTIVFAPLAAWIVAVAVAKPLAWRPASYLQDFGSWLPQLVFWSLILVSPLAVLHAWLDLRLIDGVGARFWPIALFDGVLSAVIILVSLGLALTAYRRVARDNGSIGR